MKLYKSFLAFSLMTMTLMGCSTDDLENDINDLKDKVAEIEAQVQKMNDNMNILRIALDGNKTIQSVVDNGDGSHELLLSDGSKIVLTQGVEGSAHYPSVSVDGEGFWVIDGVKQDVKAQAENGADGVTPKFRLMPEGNKYYWQVSYDNGKTFEYLYVGKDKVQANAEGSIPPSSNGPIQDVTVADGLLNFTCGGQKYSIAIIEDLKCVINIPEGEKEEGFWMVPKANSAEITVDIMGDAKLVSASEGWSAEFTAANKLRVTAPAAVDAEGVVTIQVNKGLSWIVEKINVKSKFVPTSNFEKFNVGAAINIGEIVLKKIDDSHVDINGESIEMPVKVVASNSEITTANGIYFIEKGVTVTHNFADNHTALIIIGNDLHSQSTLQCKSQIKLNKAEAKTGYLLIKNINADFSTLDGYPIVQNGANIWDHVIFYECTIRNNAKNPLSYISSSNRAIGNFEICNSFLPYEKVVDKYFILNISSSTSTDYGVKFNNNVVYSKKGLMGFYKIFNTTNNKAGGLQNIEINNNMFINIVPNTEGFIRATVAKSLEFQNNVIWFDQNTGSNQIFFRNSINSGKFQAGTLTGFVKNNLAKEETGKKYQAFFGGVSPIEGDEDTKVVAESPFETYDLANGQFVLKGNFQGYGPAGK